MGALTEFLLDAHGTGELRVLMPALASLSRSPAGGPRRGIIWISPPYVPYAPALTQHGVDLSAMLIVRADESVECLWAMEQALRSKACAAVLGWVSAVEERTLRRLQLAAEAGACWAVLFRHTRFQRRHSPAALRIHLSPRMRGLSLNILKSRGGRPGLLQLDC